MSQHITSPSPKTYNIKQNHTREKRARHIDSRTTRELNFAFTSTKIAQLEFLHHILEMQVHIQIVYLEYAIFLKTVPQFTVFCDTKNI